MMRRKRMQRMISDREARMMGITIKTKTMGTETGAINNVTNMARVEVRGENVVVATDTAKTIVEVMGSSTRRVVVVDTVTTTTDGINSHITEIEIMIDIMMTVVIVVIVVSKTIKAKNRDIDRTTNTPSIKTRSTCTPIIDNSMRKIPNSSSKSS